MTTTINAVISRLPKPLMEESSISDVKGWIFDALRLLPDSVLYTNKVGFFELEDGKMYLPKELIKVNSVIWQYNDPSKECLTAFGCSLECPDLCEPEEIRTQVCRLPVYFQIFLQSNYYRDCFALLSYAGRDKSLLCDKCPNLTCASDYRFVITPEKILYTEPFDCGWLCINYSTLLCNEAGDILIPDNQNVIEFLVAYVNYRHWEERSFLKEDNAVQMYDRYARMKDILYAKARGSIILRSVEIQAVLDATESSYMRLLKASDINGSFR